MTKPMKYKVGDRVRIRRDLNENMSNDDYDVEEEMISKAGRVVTISDVYDDAYRIYEFRFWWTDEMFEGLAEDELTAEEAIRLKVKMCVNTLCTECKFWKHNNSEDISCSEFSQKHPEQVVEALKQWKKDHEKIEVETEFVYLIRVMKEEGDSSTCIYTYEVKEDKDDIDEKMDELVKQYYEENGGKIYAKLERICRVKPSNFV